MKLLRYQRGVFGGVARRRPAPASGIVYTLSGSSGTPNIATDSTMSPTDAESGWSFFTDGRVFEIESSTSQFQDGIEWTDEQDSPTEDIWIRGANELGDDPTSGPALDTWHVLHGSGEATRQWLWTETGNGFFTTSGTLKVELSTDSGGSSIVATGYYRGVSSVEL